MEVLEEADIQVYIWNREDAFCSSQMFMFAIETFVALHDGGYKEWLISTIG